jgi:hypothetical protein
MLLYMITNNYTNVRRNHYNYRVYEHSRRWSYPLKLRLTVPNYFQTQIRHLICPSRECPDICQPSIRRKFPTTHHCVSRCNESLVTDSVYCALLSWKKIRSMQMNRLDQKVNMFASLPSGMFLFALKFSRQK